MHQLIETLAREMRIKPDAIKQWRSRGCVPHRHRLPMVAAAREKGKKLTEADFEWEKGEPPAKPRKAA